MVADFLVIPVNLEMNLELSFEKILDSNYRGSCLLKIRVNWRLGFFHRLFDILRIKAFDRC